MLQVIQIDHQGILAMFKKISSSPFCLPVIGLVFAAFAQASMVPLFSVFAASLAYALLWKELGNLNAKKLVFCSFSWFFILQFVQLFWMTAIEYQGYYIYLVLSILLCLMSLQFSLLSAYVVSVKNWTIWHYLAASGAWTLMEWSRLFFLSGFPWNPVGMALASNIYSMQMASVAGVYGLSFYLVFVNLLAYRALFFQASLRKIWIISAAFPYVFGVFHLYYHEQKMLMDQRPQISCALVHTALSPHDKDWQREGGNPYADAYRIWYESLADLAPDHQKKIDFLVFPETMQLFGAHRVLYPFEIVKQTFQVHFGASSHLRLAEMEEPFARPLKDARGDEWFVSNAYWAQSLSNFFQCDVIAGFEDDDTGVHGERRSYNAAFHFQPYSRRFQRYEKQILIPGSEYTPFKWLASLARLYGIEGSFTAGQRSRVFLSSHHGIPFSTIICSEEIYPNHVRKSRKLGSQLFVSLHNDSWFPRDQLAWQHFDHGRLRTVENGVPLLRSSNAGVTAAVDSLGRVVASHSELWKSGVLYLNIPQYTFSTLYTFWGDYFIVVASLLFCFSALIHGFWSRRI